MIKRILITAYVLLILSLSATARAEMRNFPFPKNHQVKTKSYVGELAVTVDGRFFLIQDEERYFELQTEKDLSDFNGETVQVIGYELKHKSGPVVETYSLDPLSDEMEQDMSAPVLIVFEVREI